MARRRPPHLLRVDGPAERFAALFAAVGAAGGRVGWLELAPPGALPAALEAAVAGGAARAVAAGGGRSAAVKALRGAPVLADLLREHFRGTVLVLVRGEIAAPLLTPSPDGWKLTAPGGDAPRRWTTERLVAALASPRPWGAAPPRDPDETEHHA